MSTLGWHWSWPRWGAAFLIAALGRGLCGHFPAEGSGQALNTRFVSC